MFDQIKPSKSIVQLEFTIPEDCVNINLVTGHKQLSKMVKQEIRSFIVTIHPPKNKRYQLSETKVYAIHCIESSLPNEERVIEWILLTKYPVSSLKASIKVINWYLC